MADDKKLEEIVFTRLMRLNAVLQGIVTGVVAGGSVFVATNWLILEGGHIGPHGQPVVGPHLSLLGHFFIGYKVSFVGSLIGFAYGFVAGFAIGYFVARTYNWIVERKELRGRNQKRA